MNSVTEYVSPFVYPKKRGMLSETKCQISRDLVSGGDIFGFQHLTISFLIFFLNDNSILWIFQYIDNTAAAADSVIPLNFFDIKNFDLQT